MKPVVLPARFSDALRRAMLRNLYPNYSLDHICEQAYRDLYRHLKRIQAAKGKP